METTGVNPGSVIIECGPNKVVGDLTKVDRTEESRTETSV